MAGTDGPRQGKATVNLAARRAARVAGTGAFLVAVGVLLSLATAATLPLPLLVGRLVDALGARRVVVAAQIMQAAGFLAYLVVTGPATILLAALVVAGGQRAFWSSFFALATEFSGAGPSGYRLLLADRPYIALIAVNTSFALCSTLLAVALPVYIVDGLPAPPWLSGPLLGMNTVLLAVGQALVMRVVRAVSRARALALAGASWTVWCIGLALLAPLRTEPCAALARCGDAGGRQHRGHGRARSSATRRRRTRAHRADRHRRGGTDRLRGVGSHGPDTPHLLI